MKSLVVHAFGLFATVLVAGAAGAQSTQAVEWKVSEGGNGHWYGLRIAPGKISQSAAQALAVQEGGHLLSACGPEYEFAVSQTGALSPTAWSEYSGSLAGPWIGLRLVQNQWIWLDGSSCVFDHWDNGNNQPNSGSDIVALLWSPSTNTWNRCHDNTDAAWTRSYIVEWDTDCNNDGIVDYGQIKSGQLDDDNGDGIPDACQYSVTGVIPVSGASSGGTAITIKGANFPDNPVVRVGGVLATDVVRVSATRITAVTPAGLPGMTSVTVGNWVQPNAFYYRPECGSDLDQDGEVTAADIAIVLLDFGPCYAPPAASQPEDSRPFMLREEPVPEIPLRK